MFLYTSHYQYHGYGTCFDSGGGFTSGNITNGKNVIIFGCDMSFSSHATNRANNIYVLGKDFVQGISTTVHTTICAEKLYKTNFTEQDKNFVLSLHYNGDDSYLFANSVQQLKFKTKDGEIQRNPSFLGNISSDWSLRNSAKTGLFRNAYDFAVDYVPINGVGTIYDIRRYLMTKRNI